MSEAASDGLGWLACLYCGHRPVAVIALLFAVVENVSPIIRGAQ
jgi:hypothetical protein